MLGDDFPIVNFGTDLELEKPVGQQRVGVFSFRNLSEEGRYGMVWYWAEIYTFFILWQSLEDRHAHYFRSRVSEDSRRMCSLCVFSVDKFVA